MKNLNSFLIDASRADVNMCYRLLMSVSKPQIKDELSMFAQQGMLLCSTWHSIRDAGGILWLLEIANMRRNNLSQAIVREKDSKAKKCKWSILKQFSNKLTKLVGKSF